MYKYFLISLMLACFTATAGIYKWVDENGKVHYSDTEVEGAEQVELPETTTFTPTSVAKTNKTETKEAPGYTEMAVVKPKMNETIRNNTGDVGVSISLTPGRRPGDSITLYMDGKELMKGKTGTSFTLKSVDRGSHTLKASVFDKTGVSMISSMSVIFHLQREIAEEKESSTKDNSKAYKPDYDQDESKEADYKKDFSKDYSDDSSKDYDSSSTYEDGAKKFKKGVPSSSGTFKSKSSTYSPNYNQK